MCNIIFSLGIKEYRIFPSNKCFNNSSDTSFAALVVRERIPRTILVLWQVRL